MRSRRATLRSACGLVALVTCATLAGTTSAQDTRLLRQPTLSDTHVVFAHGGDLWIVDRDGGLARRLTSTPAVESDPHFSPDGRRVAFSSNRSGTTAVYVLPIGGGTPQRLTWYPADAFARGWTPDGGRILHASGRQTAPVGYDRLWTVPAGGGPSERLPAPWGHDGAYAPDGRRVVIDRVQRWDAEWRHYRGGQNTPVLLINELAGSGGDFFPWIFRQQGAGPLIGTRTWGGLVKSSVHYPLIDGGALTAPDNAVFDPVGMRWIGENVGIPPDIEVRLDARSVADGRDPQLERGVAEALRLLEEHPPRKLVPPPFSTPARRPATAAE